MCDRGRLTRRGKRDSVKPKPWARQDEGHSEREARAATAAGKVVARAKGVSPRPRGQHPTWPRDKHPRRGCCVRCLLNEASTRRHRTADFRCYSWSTSRAAVTTSQVIELAIP